VYEVVDIEQHGQRRVACAVRIAPEDLMKLCRTRIGGSNRASLVPERLPVREGAVSRFGNEVADMVRAFDGVIFIVLAAEIACRKLGFRAFFGVVDSP